MAWATMTQSYYSSDALKLRSLIFMFLFTLQKLEWVVDEDLQSRVSDARSQLDSLDMDTDLEVFNFPGYGKEFIKSARCSPDAWLQMSLQLTMFR